MRHALSKRALYCRMRGCVSLTEIPTDQPTSTPTPTRRPRTRLTVSAVQVPLPRVLLPVRFIHCLSQTLWERQCMVVVYVQVCSLARACVTDVKQQHGPETQQQPCAKHAMNVRSNLTCSSTVGTAATTTEHKKRLKSHANSHKKESHRPHTCAVVHRATT